MKRIPLFLKKKMERILCFLDKYSNVLIAFSACLTTIATFLIWGVAREQTEVTYLMEKAAKQPIIKTDYISETLHEYTLRNNMGSTVEKGKEIWTVQVRNVGSGSAHNLKIERRGRETIEIDTLPVGEKREYFVFVEEIRSKKVSSTVKVKYQDIFENEFTIGY